MAAHHAYRIDALKARGYVFVTVPQLMAPGVAEPGKVYRP